MNGKTGLIYFIALPIACLSYKNGSCRNKIKITENVRSLQQLTPPHFPGGEVAFHQYLSRNIKWPDVDKDVQGTVLISFYVEKDGTLADIHVLKGMGKAFDEEALRVIKNMPKWVPALKDKQPIKSKYSVPIRFTFSSF